MVYCVELVLVIDSTRSMEHVLNTVKKQALSLGNDILVKAAQLQKHVDQIKIKVIGFRDFYGLHMKKIEDVIQESSFFDLSKESEVFKLFVDKIQPLYGEDERVSHTFENLEGQGPVNLDVEGVESPESGLEALNLAIRSEWKKESSYRQIIAIWTDATAHPLSSGQVERKYFTKDKIIKSITRREGHKIIEYNMYNISNCPVVKPDFYPKGLSQTLKELTSEWGQTMNVSAKRLVLFAPYVYPWQQISDNWDNVIHWNSSDNNLTISDYNVILEVLVNSI